MWSDLPRSARARKLAAALVAFASACACGAGRAEPIESRFPIVEGSVAIDVVLRLSSDHARAEHRWSESLKALLHQQLRLLGAAPYRSLVIADRGAAASVPASAPTVVISVPILTSQRGMAVEAALADGVARALWRASVPCAGDGAALIDGLARYAAVMSLAAQFDGLRDPPAAGNLERRLFGGLVPWVLRVSVPAWSRNEMRTALAMRTFENWIGEPLTEAALRQFVAAAQGRCRSRFDLRRAAEDVTGLDLSWFFEQAFDAGRAFDYGVDRVDANSVIVQRYGDGQFRGVAVTVRFTDGSSRDDRWDGRGPRHEFHYDAAPPIASVVVDPAGVIALDADRTNNSWAASPRASAAATKWSALWLAWLEHALLTSASLV